MDRSTRIKTLLLISALLLGGCAASQPAKEKVDDNALYEGRSTVAFSSLPVAETAEEGIRLGDQQQRAGEYDKALYMYIQAMQLDETNTEALYKIGSIHMNRGNTGKAVMAFEGVLARDPGHIYGNEALGMQYLKANRYQEAEQFFNRALSADLARLGDEDAEGTDAEPTVDVQSPSHAYNGMGVIADLRGEHALAQGYYTLALQIAPNASITHNNRGYSYYLSQQWREAEVSFKRALKLDPRSVQAWRNLALLYARQERYVAALGAFEQVMDSANAHNDLGYICLLEGKYERAEHYFEQAMTLSPTYYAKAHENMKLVQRLRESRVTQR